MTIDEKRHLTHQVRRKCGGRGQSMCSRVEVRHPVAGSFGALA